MARCKLDVLWCKMSAAATLGTRAFYSSILGFVTALRRTSFILFPAHFLPVFFTPPRLSLSPLIHPLQVELDLKRLRDPLQLQLPVQQLTTSKNWWDEWLPPLSAPTTPPLPLPSCRPTPFSPPLLPPATSSDSSLPPPSLPHPIIPSLSWLWELVF